ncbi:MAG TPA: hypothetical protein G4N94_10325 [Caldilineae bacterium]|nr:hypothetical protein [Caldilineae bacterium]
MIRVVSGFALFLIVLVAGFLASCASFSPPILPSSLPETPALTPTGDDALRRALAAYDIRPLEPLPDIDPDKIELGRMLFFDKELGGNRDTSCATCHHPDYAGGDGIPLSVGTGGLGLGPERLRGAMRPLVPRNAPELFNRGQVEWRTMFWDSRVEGDSETGFTMPAEFEGDLPDGLENVVAAQALFPITSGAEMRGGRGDVDVFGRDNELGRRAGDDLAGVWQDLMLRMTAIPEYRAMFAAVYPDVATEDLSIVHAVNAIAAFEIAGFTFLDSPWDRYLRGDDGALSEQAKQGALLFYGKAGCVGCHNGKLLTDQQHHNIAAPQIGPGKGREAPYTDLGRFRETADPADRYAFRTPPLRNVTLTGPWLHDGAYDSLEAVIRHHLDPQAALAAYDQSHLPPHVQSDSRWSEAVAAEMIETLDPLVAALPDLSDEEVMALLAFLDALTDPAAADLSHLLPDRVPSGLPVPDRIEGPTAFANVTAQAGIAAPHFDGYQVMGQAWADVDLDGWLDLYLTDGGGPNRLYRNNGDGSFDLSPVADQVALPDHRSSGAVFADYDNDGWADLYVVGRGPNVLFHNDGGAGFSDVTGAAGVGDAGVGKTASWGDYDGDGFLDLFVANWACSPGCPHPLEGDKDRLFHNNGDGTFTDVTLLLGPHTRGASFVAAFTDYDNDGDADIYLVLDEFITPIGNKLWRNDGPGCGGWCFEMVAAEAGADASVMGMGLSVDDFDADGDFDFYFAEAGEMTLLRNDGEGHFESVASEAGVALDDSTIGWGSISLDYDNDGYRDIYQALMLWNDRTSPYNPLFHNNGDGTFTNLDFASGAADPGPSIGVAYADYDNDGWVDFVLGNYHRSYQLYHNEALAAGDNHWLTLKLVGGGPVNRDAVGAKAFVTTGDGRTQVQEVRCGLAMGSGNALALYFGLGPESGAQVEIRWPDGTSQALGFLAADQAYEIRYDAPPVMSKRSETSP